LPEIQSIGVHVEADASGRIRVGLKTGNSRSQRHATVDRPGERSGFALRNLTQASATPFNAYGIGVVRIVGLAQQRARLADPEMPIQSSPASW